MWGLLVLGLATAAALVAVIVYFLGSKRAQTGETRPEATEDLEARYQSALGQLREHVANKHLQPVEEFERERSRMEAVAAEILKARDRKRQEPSKKQGRVEKKTPATGALDPKHPALMTALVGAAMLAFLALLGFQLDQSSSENPLASPRPGMAGADREEPAEEDEPDPRLEELAARVQSNPQDADALADLSLHLLRVRAYSEARPLIHRTTLMDPFNPKGRVARAVVRAVDGDFQSSLEELETLATRYPQAYEARMFAGMIALQKNDRPRALSNWEAYVAQAPLSDQPPMMRMIVAQLKQQLAAPP